MCLAIHMFIGPKDFKSLNFHCLRFHTAPEYIVWVGEWVCLDFPDVYNNRIVRLF